MHAIRAKAEICPFVGDHILGQNSHAQHDCEIDMCSLLPRDLFQKLICSSRIDSV